MKRANLRASNKAAKGLLVILCSMLQAKGCGGSFFAPTEPRIEITDSVAVELSATHVVNELSERSRQQLQELAQRHGVSVDVLVGAFYLTEIGKTSSSGPQQRS